MNFTDLKQILRHLARKRLYSGISILGLGIGLGCVILISTYIIHEFSFDKYHSKSSRIYRVVDGKNCATYYAMGEDFKKELPEIENVFNIFSVDNVQIKQNQQFINEDNLILTDPSIFDILDLEIITGTNDNQLTEANTIIISEKKAKKYFPGENPIGELLQIAIDDKILNLRVTGVFKNFPSYSSLRADFIGDISLAFPNLLDVGYALGFEPDKPGIDFRNEWKMNEFRTFILLRPETNSSIVEQKCNEISLNRRGENKDGGIHLQPLTDIYLHSNDLNNTNPFLISQLGSLRIYLAIGFLILLVACINFILISNADIEQSIKEIACRKVNGASEGNIFYRIMFKTVLISFISLIPALLFVSFAIPFFNQQFQKDLSIELFIKLPYLTTLLALTLLTGISAGLYLGISTSGVSPTKLFQKGTNPDKRKVTKLSMVIAQFVIFILLATCLLVMKKQFNYALSKDLGLNTRNVIITHLMEDEYQGKFEFISNELAKDPNVIACLPTSFTIPPYDSYIRTSYKGKDGQPKSQEVLILGPGVVELLKIKLLEGQSFNETNTLDRTNILINEAAARKYNLNAGDKIDHFTVIGVVKNFHYHSIHRPIEPIFILPQTQQFSSLLIKTNGNNKEVGTHLKQICEGIAPGILCEYETLDENIAKFYEKEKNQMGMIGFFSLIALTLSLTGLFGFVSLNLSRRTKEIGIRIINGAKSIELVNMLNFQYAKCVIIAFIIACPITWYAMYKWLESFAYKTEISWWIFAASGLVAMIVALLTVSWQSWRAATRNPVDALRYE
jgi:putative ABC transport system permease protein